MSNSNLIVNILNTYIEYFNSIENVNTTLFDGIDYKKEESTNYQLEKLYNIISEYKNDNNNYPHKLEKIYPENKSECEKISKAENLYSLEIDSKIIYYCQNIYIILNDISEQNYNNWKIVSLR